MAGEDGEDGGWARAMLKPTYRDGMVGRSSISGRTWDEKGGANGSEEQDDSP